MLGLQHSFYISAPTCIHVLLAVLVVHLRGVVNMVYALILLSLVGKLGVSATKIKWLMSEECCTLLYFLKLGT